ncbi:sialidase family protein [Glycomyces niveus]|uniref:Xyloglucanase n=1 Tax=Glycomyces niveus TaxID=2820287 RepID=A0ABS3U843_9ACTN|nr:sialidase family protein [Glycomyces sp. NEAU-S30]MBO3734953.1 xyloglucanase [Glycomyces sp. NEAU-S30]
MRRRTFTASLGAAAVAATAVPGAAAAATSRRCDDAYTWRNAVVNGGGYVPGIVFNETEPDLIYARTDIGGLYRWQEGTQSWLPLLDWIGWDQWGWTGVVSVATDPVETNRVYAAVGTYTNDWDPSPGAVLYSDDKGATWGVAELPFKQGGNMPGRGMGERLAVDPADNANLYLGTPNGNGLWKSADFGRTWAKVESFPNAGNFVQDPGSDYSDDNQGVVWIDFDLAGGRTFVGVADPDDPLYVSSDGGATWQAVPGAAAALGTADGNRTIPKQAAFDHENGHLFIVTGWDPGPYNGAPASGRGGSVQRLTLATGEWTDVTPGHNPIGAIPGFGGLTVDRKRPGTLMAATQNNWWPDEIIYRSTDSGQTWETSWDYVWDANWSWPPARTDRFTMDASGSEWLSFGHTDDGPAYAVKHGWMIDALAIDPHDSDRIMWGTGATIWGTERLTEWDGQGPLVGWDAEAGHQVTLPVEPFTVAVRAEGLEETAVQDIAALGGTLVSAMGDLGGFVQTDLGRAGTQIRRPNWTSGRGVDFAGLHPDVVVGTGDVEGDADGHVGVSTDGGATWLTTARLEGVAGGGNAGSVAVNADGSVVVWSPGNGTTAPVYSTDLGQTWTPVEGLPAGALVRSDRSDPNRLYALASGVFYASVDGGTTFAATPATGLPAEGNVDFRAVPGKRRHLWLTGGKTDGVYGMWRSTDGGRSWRRIRDFEEADAVGFGKGRGRRGYPAIFTSAKAGGKRGIWRSTDEGLSWQRVNDDAHQWAWTGKAISGDPEVYGRVYIATNGRGLVYGDIAE